MFEQATPCREARGGICSSPPKAASLENDKAPDSRRKLAILALYDV